QGFVVQSLLSVRESAQGVRYRMLETVREFGRMQLIDAGEDVEARAAMRRWATGYAHDYGARLTSNDQFAAIDAIGAEEINLTDELRSTMATGDRCAAVQLLAPLGIFPTIPPHHRP